MAEDPATWGQAEHIIHKVLSYTEDAWGQDDEVCGLSIERQITIALREAGLLVDNSAVASTSEPDPLEPPSDFEMYTSEGDQAVHELCIVIRRMLDSDIITSKRLLESYAQPLVKSLAKEFPEVYDTEPRNHIASYLDTICDAKGWAYDEWEGYDLG